MILKKKTGQILSEQLWTGNKIKQSFHLYHKFCDRDAAGTGIVSSGLLDNPKCASGL